MFKWLFGKKEECDDTAADTEKWIGRIKGSYTTSDEEGNKIEYHIMWDLYIDESTGERIVRGYGKGLYPSDTPFTHQFYKTILLAWEEGAPDELLVKHLSSWDTEYWEGMKESNNTEYEWKEV